MIRNISIPWNVHCSALNVYVDVDSDGMILAAQENQSNIYVITPADGKIVNTITMQGKVVRGKIQALLSGDIVVKTSNKEFTVISRSGQEKVTQCAVYSVCSVEKLTDTVHIIYWDNEHIGRKMALCNTIMVHGIIHPQPRRKGHKNIGPCLVTPTGYLVTCEGNSLHVYKKRFIVYEIRRNRISHTLQA